MVLLRICSHSLAGKVFPKLKYLGLMNSEIANDIAAVVVNAPDREPY